MASALQAYLLSANYLPAHSASFKRRHYVSYLGLLQEMVINVFKFQNLPKNCAIITKRAIMVVADLSASPRSSFALPQPHIRIMRIYYKKQEQFLSILNNVLLSDRIQESEFTPFSSTHAQKASLITHILWSIRVRSWASTSGHGLRDLHTDYVKNIQHVIWAMQSYRKSSEKTTTFCAIQ